MYTTLERLEARGLVAFALGRADGRARRQAQAALPAAAGRPRSAGAVVAGGSRDGARRGAETGAAMRAAAPGPLAARTRSRRRQPPRRSPAIWPKSSSRGSRAATRRGASRDLVLAARRSSRSCGGGAARRQAADPPRGDERCRTRCLPRSRQTLRALRAIAGLLARRHRADSRSAGAATAIFAAAHARAAAAALSRVRTGWSSSASTTPARPIGQHRLRDDRRLARSGARRSTSCGDPRLAADAHVAGDDATERHARRTGTISGCSACSRHSGAISRVTRTRRRRASS